MKISDKSWPLVWMVLLLLVIITYLCAWQSEFWQGKLQMSAGKERQAKAEEQVTFLLGVSQANLIEPWRIIMNDELRQESAQYPDMRLIFTDAAQNSQKQIQDVEGLLQQGIDLLIISPNDSVALTPIVAAAYRQIPVIVLDRAVEGYDYTLYVGPDNKAIGREAGKYAAELLGLQGGKLVEIQGPVGLPAVRERAEGFREVLAQHEELHLLDTLIGDWQRDEAEDKMTDLLARHPDVDVVFVHNDYMALGAYQAAAKLGIKHLKLIGVDGFSGARGGLQLVAEQVLQGTFTCPTGGREAIQYAVDILQHADGLPKKIITRSNKVTKANVEQYLHPKLEATASAVNRKILLGFSQVGAESDWRRSNSKSIKNAALSEGIDLVFMEGDQQQETQLDAIRKLIAAKVDVIAFSPVVESGWEEVLQEARAAGIPVILTDRTIKPDDDLLYASFIGSDFREEGRRAGRWLLTESKNWGRVNIIELEGTFGSGPAVERKQGFAEIIAGQPRCHLLESEVGDFTREKGEELMAYALQCYGREIDVVFAHNDDMALGAIQAIRNFGLQPGRDIRIVSIDATAAAFRAMLSGNLNCTVECTPLLGPQLMKAVKNLVAGRQLPVRMITSEEVFPLDSAKNELRNRKY